jgi:hypothetical protein
MGRVFISSARTTSTPRVGAEIRRTKLGRLPALRPGGGSIPAKWVAEHCNFNNIGVRIFTLSARHIFNDLAGFHRFNLLF